MKVHHENFRKTFMKGFIMALLAGAVIALCTVLIGLFTYLSIKYNW